MSSPMALPTDPSVDTVAELDYLFNVCTIVTAVLLGMSTVAVGLRIFSRMKFAGGLAWDDALMVAAQICFVVTAVLNFVAVYCERILITDGRWVVGLEPLVQIIRYSNAIYTLTMIVVKISVALYFLRLFSSRFRWQRVTIITLTAISGAMGLAYFIFTIASCGIMVQSQKTTALKTGTDWCPVQDMFVDFSIAWGFINAIVDFVFAGMAIALVWGAKLERSAKLSAACLILLGCLGSVASCARIAVQMPLGDIRMAGVLLGIWSNVEAGLCITAASLMTLRPMFKAAVDKCKSVSGSQQDQSGKDVSYDSSMTQVSSGSANKDHRWSRLLDAAANQEDDKMAGVIVTKSWATESRDRESV